MNATIITMYLTVTTALRDYAERAKEDKGQTAVEWLGIAAVTVAIIAAVVGKSDAIGTAIENALKGLIGQAAAGER